MEEKMQHSDRELLEEIARRQYSTLVQLDEIRNDVAGMKSTLQKFEAMIEAVSNSPMAAMFQ